MAQQVPHGGTASSKIFAVESTRNPRIWGKSQTRNFRLVCVPRMSLWLRNRHRIIQDRKEQTQTPRRMRWVPRGLFSHVDHFNYHWRALAHSTEQGAAAIIRLHFKPTTDNCPFQPSEFY